MQKLIVILTIAFLLIVAPTLLAQTSTIDLSNNLNETKDDEITAWGIDLEELLSLINGIIALILFLLTFIAYRVDGRKKLLYISIAFLIFSIKSFLVSSELFIPEIEWLEPTAIVLEFLVIMLFFFGVVKKEG